MQRRDTCGRNTGPKVWCVVTRRRPARVIVLLLAHRGWHAAAAENSVAAFGAAVALGVDGIETDVRVSRDGLPVVIHDRLTPRKRPVADLTRREIESDCGHAVPLLPEILEAFPDVFWNIEIKSTDAWSVAAPVLARFQSTRRLLVTSFRHDVVLRCAQTLEVDCGLLLAERPLDMRGILAFCATACRVNHAVWDFNIVDDELLREVSAAGWKNYAYGVVTLAEYAWCRGAGFAGVILSLIHI